MIKIKKHFTFLVFMIFFGFDVIAQEKNTLLGISIQPATISQGISLGIGLTVNYDYKDDGLGWGGIVDSHYLLPESELKEIIKYGYTVEGKFKYDFSPIEGFEFGPNAGFGFYGLTTEPIGSTSTQSIEEFYLVIGGNGTYQLSEVFFIGLNLALPFLEGADFTINTNLTFKI